MLQEQPASSKPRDGSNTPSTVSENCFSWSPLSDLSETDVASDDASTPTKHLQKNTMSSASGIPNFSEKFQERGLENFNGHQDTPLRAGESMEFTDDTSGDSSDSVHDTSDDSSHDTAGDSIDEHQSRQVSCVLEFC
jgi:hypothetical protein